MSNASLREQLEALSLSGKADKTHSNEASHKRSETRQPQKKSKSKPAWLEQAQYGVELLKAYFPACFKESKEIKPLKVGIKQDLAKYLSTREDIVIGDKSCMISSLAYYVNSLAYHKAAVAGASRIDLEGQSVGEVTAEEAKYSEEYRKAKMQQKEKA